MKNTRDSCEGCRYIRIVYVGKGLETRTKQYCSVDDAEITSESERCGAYQPESNLY